MIRLADAGLVRTIVFAICALFLISCGDSGSKTDSNKDPVGQNITWENASNGQRIFANLEAAYLPLTANLPLFVALDQKFFEKYGVTVNAIESGNPNDIISGIAAGNLDFAAVIAYTLLFPADQKFPDSYKLFSSSEENEENYTSSIIALRDSPINSVDDLRGKKIGVYTGLVQLNFLKSILAGIGINEDEVEIVQISPRLQIQGLVSGEYDALSSTEPTVNIALSRNIAKVISASPRVKYIMSPFPSTAAPISTKLIKENPKAALAVVLALEDAIDFINEHPDEAVQSLLNYTPIPKDGAQNILMNLKLFKYSKLGQEDRLKVQEFADFMFEHDLIEQPVEDVDELFGSKGELFQAAISN